MGDITRCYCNQLHDNSPSQGTGTHSSLSGHGGIALGFLCIAKHIRWQHQSHQWQGCDHYSIGEYLVQAKFQEQPSPQHTCSRLHRPPSHPDTRHLKIAEWDDHGKYKSLKFFEEECWNSVGAGCDALPIDMCSTNRPQSVLGTSPWNHDNAHTRYGCLAVEPMD